MSTLSSQVHVLPCQLAMRHWRPAAIVTLGAVAALTALTADALATQARPAPSAEATAPRAAGEPIMAIVSIKSPQGPFYAAEGGGARARAGGEPIMAIVSIKSQQVTFYDAEGWILRAPVSTGTEGRET